ncbi:hypothetical protein HFP89_13050 [Wenzhouxiangella sp. XN79A]|uniref:hypothetical protein n=1 Tax=Wenzhouxiangella sp. XN79A TaxID=2724193 RepID=UPI00144AE10B|nr:hypothetical protein [Wenzhouxiangella sp. XN79A]NKI36091.1 hypothetical protein [Wenzhouxiangella sp. XN79A]
MNRTRFHAACLRTAIPIVGLVVLAGCASSPSGNDAPDCSDPARFRLGLEGAPVPAACSVPAPDEAYGLGEMIRERRATIERVSARLDAEPAPDPQTAVQLRQQRIRAQGELPDLEALARLEGWLPPATLPDR